MGFALSITAAILLLGALLMVAVYYPPLAQSYEELTDAMKDMHERQLSELRTSLEVHDNKGNVVTSLKSTGMYSLYNSGETTIDLDKLVVLENGAYTTKELFQTDVRWLYPAGEVHLTGLTQFSGSLKIVCANGATLTVKVT